jgi:cell wall-associated NlpC family hydrolase
MSDTRRSLPPASAKTRMREVSVSLAPLLSVPDAPGLIAQLRLGEQVRAGAASRGWTQVQRLRDDYVGWAPSAALMAPGAAPTHRVAAPLAHFYPTPDIKTRPSDLAPMGALLSGVPEGRFMRVAQGWVALAALAPAGAPAPGDPVATAEMLLGAPYLWGGESALGIDCSGLVQLAWPEAPRDSDMQAAEWGAPLPNPWEGGDAAAPLPPLVRGDLVFWRGHVGIMVDGATLLHANAHHMRVVAEPLAGAVARIAAGATSGAGQGAGSGAGSGAGQGAGQGAGLPIALRRG